MTTILFSGAALIVATLVLTRPAFLSTNVVSPSSMEAQVIRRQVLAVLREDVAAQQVERLQRHYRVIGLLRPRIIVLDLDSDAAAQLRRDPDITGVFEREVPADIVARLTADERLFVSAWAQQQATVDKKRRGDGLPWDSPGFEPPDLPQGSKRGARNR